MIGPLPFWKLGIAATNCDTTCSAIHMYCDIDNSFVRVTSEKGVADAMLAAGVVCNSFNGSARNTSTWDGPWRRDSDGACEYSTDTMVSCSVAPPAGHSRLCPCRTFGDRMHLEFDGATYFETDKSVSTSDASVFTKDDFTIVVDFRTQTRPPPCAMDFSGDGMVLVDGDVNGHQLDFSLIICDSGVNAGVGDTTSAGTTTLRYGHSRGVCAKEHVFLCWSRQVCNSDRKRLELQSNIASFDEYFTAYTNEG